MISLPALSWPQAQPTPYDPVAAIGRQSRIAYIVLTIFLFGFVLAAAVVPMGGAVIGTGQVGVESRVKRIAHPTGGIIAEIRVRDGQKVRRGQILMRLDTSVSGISADLSARSVDQLLAQRARLLAEREGRTTMAPPPEFAGRTDASARDAMAAEQRLIALHRQERAALRGQLTERVAQLQRQIEGYRAQIASLQQQKTLIEPELGVVRDLYDRQLVTIRRKNELERTAIELDGSIGSLQSSIAQATARISETREQTLGLEQRSRAEAGEELARVMATLNSQQVETASAGDRFERSIIRAPYDGIVDKLAFSTIGGVIQSAETIMEIVPTSDRLIVEGGVSPADIDRIASGQAARVRFTAFSTSTTPEIAGKVSFISAERFTDEKNGASFYRVRVALDEDQVTREKLSLKPGMPVEILLSTGERTMLSYVLKPLRDQLERSFRD